ncbi:MAG TPA: hypothetical protein VFQ61_31415 [Polyangiaceae bacterium]|nr:hypothetical protein [Polyangiaceae bacterium]
MAMLAACSAPSVLKPTPKGPEPKAGPPLQGQTSNGVPASEHFNRLDRDEFNQRAVLWNVPVFWRKDAGALGALDPEELAILFGAEQHARAEFVNPAAQFTPRFADIYERLQTDPPIPPNAAPAEVQRRESVRLELLQGRPTLVDTDFSKASAGERALVAHVLNAARGIERLYARQRGTLGLEAGLAADDPESAALYFRNQGPTCVAPKTEKLASCNALPSGNKPSFGLYPSNIQTNEAIANASLPGWCRLLEQQPNADALKDHFSVVEAAGTGFRATPYHVAYREDMEAVARELEQAEAALGQEEPALRRYLSAASAAFRTNQWEPANEAWVAMGSDNSRYYLRVAPDEVYYEPCAWKAGFALTFARINDTSKQWRDKLDPLKQELETELASLAGKPYVARQVGFKLPDFIDIVLNAGDSRHPHGSTVGQSLPNWGPVAERGGRTVMMANLYTDWDSRRSFERQAASLFCKASYARVTSSEEPAVLGVVLHEAAHNLGPAHEYKVAGRVDHAAFGGALAATLEELKAQSAALYLPHWLVSRGALPSELVQQALLREIAWAFGHIAQGMYDAAGRPKNYSQLAAIQLGVLQDAKLVIWRPTELARNGEDMGCFDVDFARAETATRELARLVLQIKARGDRARALTLVARYVDGKDAFKTLKDTITERWLRVPKPSFVYSIQGAGPQELL